MRVRTNRGALVAAAVLAAVLTWIFFGNGREPAVPGQPSAMNLDSYVFQGLRGALTYIAVFIPLHLLLRRRGIGGRLAYQGIGAVSAAVCIVSQASPSMWAKLAARGEVTFAIAVMLVTGLIMGYLYHWRAGYEPDADDPARLDEVLKAREAGALSVETPGAAVSDDGVLVHTGQEEYFSGPLQVRTVPGTAFVAALLSAGLYGLGRVAFGVAGEMSVRLQDGSGMPTDQALGLAVQSQLHIIWLTGMLAPLPFAIVVFLAHHVLKAMDRQSYGAYAAAGLIAPLPLVLVLGPFNPLMGLATAIQCAIPLAISMCVYRNMAGLEPKPVKEDILVRDPRNLVGENHPRRRFGRLIKT